MHINSVLKCIVGIGNLPVFRSCFHNRFIFDINKNKIEYGTVI